MTDLKRKSNSIVNTKAAVTEKKSEKPLLKRMLRHWELYALLAPVLVLVVVFCYLPMSGVIIAFKDYDPFLGAKPIEAVINSPWAESFGFQHFIDIFAHKDMLMAVINTIVLSFISLVICFPFPIMLAIMVNEIKGNKLKRTIQTVSYFPYFLSWIAVVGIFQSFLASDGALNDLISFLSGGKSGSVMFLSKNELFVPILVFITLWKTVGWNSIVYLAAIMGIDASLYEAAEMDGAGRFKQIIHVLLPGILPTVSILFILNMASLFNSNFELIYGMQNPYINFETINTLVYKNGLLNGEFSSATAVGFTQGIVAAVLVVATNKLSKKLSGNSLF